MKKGYIYNDPVYCDNGISSCENLDKINWKCSIFTNGTLLKNDMLGWFYKCELCRKLYKKTMDDE